MFFWGGGFFFSKKRVFYFRDWPEISIKAKNQGRVTKSMINVVYATAADFEGRQTEGSFKARVEYLAALIPVPSRARE
jgi:hypothetical protein